MELSDLEISKMGRDHKPENLRTLIVAVILLLLGLIVAGIRYIDFLTYFGIKKVSLWTSFSGTDFTGEFLVVLTLTIMIGIFSSRKFKALLLLAFIYFVISTGMLVFKGVEFAGDIKRLKAVGSDIKIMAEKATKNEDINGFLGNTNKYGKFTILMDSSHEMIVSSKNRVSTLNNQIQALNTKYQITPMAFKDLPSIANIQQGMREYRNVLYSEQSLYFKDLDLYISEIGRSNLPSAVKAPLLEQLRNYKNQVDAQYNEYNTAADANFAKINEYCEFFKKRQGKYSIKNNNFVFQTPTDLAEFQRITNELGATGAKVQEELQKLQQKINSYQSSTIDI